MKAGGEVVRGGAEHCVRTLSPQKMNTKHHEISSPKQLQNKIKIRVPQNLFQVHL